MPLERRSRRLTRARQLGLTLAQVGAHRRPSLSPPEPRTTEVQPVGPGRVTARTEEVAACCAYRSTRDVSSGGTVFVIRRHLAGCPAWSPG